MTPFVHLTLLEWRRTRVPLLLYFLAITGLWGGVVFHFPVLRNGDLSSDVVVLTTALWTAGAAHRSFAGDFGSGRLEFLFASGAGPRAVFASRLVVCLWSAALFAGAFGLVEHFRILWTPENLDYHSGPVYERLRPLREALYLYVLPSLGLLLFLSALTSHSGRALLLAALFVGAGVWLDTSAAGRARAAEELGFAACAWSVALLPFFVGLSMAAVWARRHESDRSNVKVLFLGAAVIALGSRHVHLEARAAAPSDLDRPVRLAVAPSGRRFAIEAGGVWRPSPFEHWSARFLSQSIVDTVQRETRRVYVGSIEGDLWRVSSEASQLDSSGNAPPWMGDETLRVCTSDGDAAVRRRWVVNARARTLASAPNLWRSRDLCLDRKGALPIPIHPVELDTELAPLADGASLWVVPPATLEVRARGGTRRTLELRWKAEP